MRDGKINKQSGILIVTLPETGCTSFHAAHGDNEKKTVYPEVASWTSIKSRNDYEARYPNMPDRIIDNLLEPKAKVSVTNWSRIKDDPAKLEFLVEATFSDRLSCEYDLARPMRRKN